MRVDNTHATKRKLIDSILSNGTYLPGSGMVQHLSDRLQTLSRDDLTNIDMIVKIKVRDAINSTREKIFQTSKP